MLSGLMKGIEIIYSGTWFVLPFVFVCSFVGIITSIVNDGKASLISTIGASVSLLIIVGGVTSLLAY